MSYESTLSPTPISAVIYWHSVAEQMPDDDLTVMIHHPDDCEPVWMGYYDSADATWRTVDGARTAVTHWANFPDSPNTKEEPRP